MEVEEGSKKAVSVTNMPLRWGFGDCGATSSLQTCRSYGALETAVLILPYKHAAPMGLVRLRGYFFLINMPLRWGFGDCGATSSLQTCRPDGALETAGLLLSYKHAAPMGLWRLRGYFFVTNMPPRWGWWNFYSAFSTVFLIHYSLYIIHYLSPFTFLPIQSNTQYLTPNTC